MVAAAAARPLDAAVGRYRDDDLAGVASGRHQPERVDRVVEAELGDGKHLQLTVAARAARIVLQEPTVPLGLQPQIQVEVDHRERGTLGQCGQPQLGIGVDVLLAQFDEPATGSQYLHTAPNRFSGQAN